ncbi:MAG: hypothetical protein KGY99_05505 [Phycisphaerae bacterium]|nr:hypothetical protein [Phycisphaerae bacterium]
MLAMVTADYLAAATHRPPGPGPVYIETDTSRWLVEPWNAASAGLFLLLAAWWLWRLRGRYRQHAFLAACLPLVVIGGVGGTVYHAFRGHRLWLLMDWMPIAVLCVATAIYLAAKLLPRWWYALLIVPLFFGAQIINFRVLAAHGQIQTAIAISYSLLGGLIVIPTVGVLWKTGGRNGRWPLLAAVCFALAIGARQLDALAIETGRTWLSRWLPMGSHFLWHVFGAAAGHCVAMYLYRLGHIWPAARRRRGDTSQSAVPAGTAANA